MKVTLSLQKIRVNNNQRKGCRKQWERSFATCGIGKCNQKIKIPTYDIHTCTNYQTILILLKVNINISKHVSIWVYPKYFKNTLKFLKIRMNAIQGAKHNLDLVDIQMTTFDHSLPI